MGKVKISKINQSQSNKSRLGLHSTQKNANRRIVPKRILLLERKLNTLQAEKESLESKNKELLENLQSEKLGHAATRRESFHYNRLYSEAMMKINSFKVKQAETAKILKNLAKDNESGYPIIVQYAGLLARNKATIQDLMSSLMTADVENLPRRQSQPAEQLSDEFNKKTAENRMKQRVGPMVRGLLITKPKIMLERIMLPPPQEQEQEPMGNSLAEVNNQLTPIQEENEHDEDVCLRHISMRPKRKLGLGSSWKAKRQEKIEKERQREESSKTTSTMGYDNDSSDSESNPPARNRVEPVVRFKDVSRLLQNSSFVKVDTSCSVDGVNGGNKFNRQPEVKTCHRPKNSVRSTEDPLEGSSWMFNNANRCSYRPPFNTETRRSSLLKSEEDEEDEDEEEIVPQTNVSSESIMNTLVNKNQTFTIPLNRLTNYSLNDNAVSSGGSHVEEPDSTNNVEIDEANSSSSSSSDSVSRQFNTSFEYSNLPNELDLDTRPSNPRPSNSNLNTIEPIVTLSDNVAHPPSKRSSTYNSSHRLSTGLSQQNQLEGKRIRKPKKHFYPGEEDVQPIPNKTSEKKSRSSLSRIKSLPDKKVKQKYSVTRSREMSLCTPRPSDADRADLGNEEGKLKRNRKKVCYKESPLNVKQRRP